MTTKNTNAEETMPNRVCREGSFDLCLRPATHVLFDFDPMARTKATATDVCASCAVETREWTGNRATFVPMPRDIPAAVRS